MCYGILRRFVNCERSHRWNIVNGIEITDQNADVNLEMRGHLCCRACCMCFLQHRRPPPRPSPPPPHRHLIPLVNARWVPKALIFLLHSMNLSKYCVTPPPPPSPPTPPPVTLGLSSTRFRNVVACSHVVLGVVIEKVTFQ